MASNHAHEHYLSAALLAGLSYAAGPAPAEPVGIGDFGPLPVYGPQKDFGAPVSEHVDDFGPVPFKDFSTDSADASPEMQKRWDAWHKQVAEAIYERYKNSALAFFKQSPPLTCQVS